MKERKMLTDLIKFDFVGCQAHTFGKISMYQWGLYSILEYIILENITLFSLSFINSRIDRKLSEALLLCNIVVYL